MNLKITGLFIALLALLAVPSLGYAQARVAQADFTTTGLADYKDDGDFKLRLFDIGLTAGIPVLLEGKNRLILSFGYETLLRSVVIDENYKYEGIKVDTGRFVNKYHLEDPLHSGKVSLFYTRKITDRWALTLHGGARHRGDFKAIELREIIPSGVIGAAVRLHETFRLTFGVAYVEALRPFYLTPGIGWIWTPKPWFHAHARLPVMSQWTFKFMDGQMEMGVFHTLKGGDYFIHDDDQEIDHWGRYTVQVGYDLGFHIWKGLWLSTQVGALPYWYFRGEDEDGEEIFAGDLEVSWFGRLALEWRLAPKKKHSR